MKIKYVISFILFFIVAAASFAAPGWVMNLEEERIYEQSYTVDKKISELEAAGSRAQKAQLTSVIYSRYRNNQAYEVSCSDSYQPTEDIFDIEDGVEPDQVSIREKNKPLAYLDELMQIDLVDASFFGALAAEEAFIYRTWMYDNGEIIYERIKIFTSRDSFHTSIVHMEIERMTNRVISLTLDKKYIHVNEESLFQYIGYLGLGVYGDWKYTEYDAQPGMEFRSAEAQMKVVCTQEGKKISIRVVPLTEGGR